MIESNSLKTDLYELTMAAGYFQNDMTRLKATFELYCHTMPPERSYLIVGGLAQAVDYILNLRFTADDIKFLRSQPAFAGVVPEFFDYLKGFRFSGDVWAMPEGEICFANEPMIQVEAPIIEAQILETYLLSITNIQTLVASKASRVVQAACRDGVQRSVVDFGSRRAHGPQAGILAARASYLAGCAGTSNVHAGKLFDIPIFGTMAHSWVEAFDNEETAYARYHDVFPENTILLIDTYDTLDGARKAARMKVPVKGVRIDSGDLNQLSRQVRNILDDEGCGEVKIIVSGNLNEERIEKLVKAKAPVDIFGVGTEMVVSRDAPALDLTYKLVQTRSPEGQVQLKAKHSQGKHTIPGRKQIFRHCNPKGTMVTDTMSLFDEPAPESARPLLTQVIQNGRITAEPDDLATIRKRVQENLALLPKEFSDLQAKQRYSLSASEEIQKVLDAKGICR